MFLVGKGEGQEGWHRGRGEEEQATEEREKRVVVLVWVAWFVRGWGIHQLTGDRAGTWSVSASGNWQITFTLIDQEICDLNLEDCH